MSGVYLHGIIIKDPATGSVLNVVVEDNIFSHSELRKKWLLTNQPHRAAYEWSWDYVTRQFVETPTDLQPIAQGWIDKNLATFDQLRAWLDRNWIGLTCDEGESARMIHIWSLLDNPRSSDARVNKFLWAYQELGKARQELGKAYRELGKARQERGKAYQEWEKADQEWGKAYQEWGKADQEWKKAYQERGKAYQEWGKADQELEEARQEWKCRVMKPIYFALLDKYISEIWR